MTLSSKAKENLFLALGLFVAVVVTFLPSLRFDFLEWDDIQYVFRNPWLYNFNSTNILGVFTHSYFANYHPLTMLGYMIQFQFFGFEPEGYRCVNILLHGLTSVAVFGAFLAFGMRRWVAFSLTLLFAIHPLRIESVVWISELKDVLCGLFYVLAFLAWILAGRTDRHEKAFLALAAICFLLSLLSKSMAVSFPLVVILYDLLLGDRARLKARLPWYAAGIILAVIFAYLNILAQEEAISDNTLGERLRVAIFAPLHYAWRTVLPVNLSPYYSWEGRPSATTAGLIGGLLICLAALTAVVYFWKRQPAVSFALLAGAVILGPVSGIVSFGGAYAADRYSYLPTIFLFFGLGVLIDRAWEMGGKTPRGVIAGFGLLFLVMFADRTARALPVWQTDLTLWQRVTELYPRSGVAGINVDAAKLKRGEDVEAQAGRWQQAAATQPGAAPVLKIAAEAVRKSGNFEAAEELLQSLPDRSDALHRLLFLYEDHGMMDRAHETASELIALDPPALPAERAKAAEILADTGDRQLALDVLEGISQPTLAAARTYGNLGLTYFGRGERRQAEELARKALRISPVSLDALRVLVSLRREQGQTSEAERLLRRALRHPAAGDLTRFYALAMLGRIAEAENDTVAAEEYFAEAFRQYPREMQTEERADGFNLMGWIAEQAGKIDKAALYYRLALRLEPEHAEALSNLSYVRLLQGKEEEALELLKRAAEYHPGDPVIRENLARLRQNIKTDGE